MKLKKLLALAMAVVLVFALAACGGDTDSENGQESTSSSNGQSGDVATLTYAIWDKNQEPGMRAIADAFEAENPDIKINIEVTGWDEYWTKLEAAGTGGALPDVFWMHINNFRKYADAGLLEGIDTGKTDLSKFPSGLNELYTIDGTLYGIPKDFDTIGLWYNKTMFDEKGIAYPDETWTWDTLVEVAAELTDANSGIYGFAAPLDTQQGYYNFIYQNGGYVISEDKTKSGFDMPETIEAIQFYTDLINKYKVSPAYATLVETSNTNLFESGKVAMILQGSWMVTEMKSNEYTHDNADVAVLPMGKERASIYNGLANAVASTSKNKEAAMKFVYYMGTEEANITQAKNGSAIPAYENTQQPWIDYTTFFSLDKYVDMLDYAVIYPTSKSRPKWDVVENDTMRKIFAGELSVEDGCKLIAEEMNAILAEE